MSTRLHPVPRAMRRGRANWSQRGQRGVASLIIVSLLFFVLSLVAAYTNRNLIFEQKTSTNQYRSTLALEAAEAGVAWALSMLNAGKLSADSCAFETDPDSTTATTFRSRYLSISPTTGAISLTAAGASSYPTCVFDGTDWDCVCPTAGTTLPDDPGTNGLSPAFRVRFLTSTRPDMVFVESQGCTRRDETCLSFPGAAVPGEGRAKIEVLLSLRNALPSPPVAALTVRGVLDAQNAALGAYSPVSGNASPIADKTGFSFMSGSPRVNAGAMRLGGPGGTPADASVLVIENEEALALPSLDAADRPLRMFTNTLLVQPATYRDQPGTVLVDCSAGCNAERIRDHAKLNPGRILWAEGNVDLDGDASNTDEDIGSVASPVMLVVNGTFNLSVTFYGVVYGVPDDWTVTGDGELNGAMIAGNNMSGGATLTVIRDVDVLSDLRFRTGSFVRSIGRWKDF